MLQSYDEVNLNEEDSYDDIEYQPYELMDYEADTEEKDEAAKKEKDKKEKKLIEESPDVFDFYKTDVEVKRGTESRKMYADLAKTAREKTGPERAKALETACYYMKGLVRKFISNKYITYIEKDRSFKDDLEQEAYMAIMKSLPDYDATKGSPSTYFYTQIKSAMSHATTAHKHQITQADAALKRKIVSIKKRYEDLGIEPSIADYVIETGETMSQIRNILRLIAMDTNTHLESIPQYDQLIAGKSDNNSAFETPENAVMKKMQIEGIIKRMHELFSDTECDMYIRYVVDRETIPAIAKKYHCEANDDRIRRIIEKVEHGMRYDPVARSYIGNRNNPEMNTIQFIPMEGVKHNMDILANLPL